MAPGVVDFDGDLLMIFEFIFDPDEVLLIPLDFELVSVQLFPGRLQLVGLNAPILKT